MDYTDANNFIFQIWHENLAVLKNIKDHPTDSLSGSQKEKNQIIDSKTVYLQKSTAVELRKLSMSKKQNKILATLYPDIILACDDLIYKNINNILAVLFFVDISGFTALSEKCAKSGDGGVYKLTTIVNNFLGRLVGSVYEHGGDVWKFSGDAFLAVWKVEVTDNMGYVIHRVLRCAMHIQKTHGHFETEFKSILRVKVGISAGNVTWCTVGDDNSRKIILVGAPVTEVNKAETACQSGDVIVTNSVWSHISPHDAVHEILPGGKFIKVLRIVGYLGLTSPKLLKLVGAPGTEDIKSNSRITINEVRCLPEMVPTQISSDLRICVIPIVLQQVDTDLPLEFLTEMRTLTIMFVTIIPWKMITTELVEVVNKTYIVIRNITMQAGGFVDKVSLFDKDIMFLCIFGLRGFFHEGRAAACLNCGHDVREACLLTPGVKDISVGITTGMSYCGVVGHPLRQEWTVIGPAVNKAARLMMVYPGQVTCDDTTKKDANLPAVSFIQAPYRPLPGFVTAEPYYKYIAEKSHVLHLTVQGGLLPLLGREKEMKIGNQLLDKLQLGDKSSSGVLFVGETKSGKSRLLDEIIVESCRRGLEPLVLGFRPSHAMVTYGAALYILASALRLSNGYSYKELHSRLNNLLSKHIAPSEVPILDEFLTIDAKHIGTNFEVNDSTKRLFILALTLGMPSSILAIDDVDMCDPASWELIMAVVKAKCKVMLLTREEGRANLIMPDDFSRYLPTIRIGILDSSCIAPLACQLLNVSAIQPEITNFLALRSQGNPGWCKTQLQTLIDNNYVTIKEVNDDREAAALLQWPPAALLEPIVTALPTLPSRPEVPKEDNGWPDEVEFDYQDHRSMVHMMSSQQWGKRAKRPMTENVETRSINPAKKGETRKDIIFHIIDAVKKNKVLTQNLACGELISDAFSTYEIIDEKLKVVPMFTSPDEIMIQESVNKFQRVKRDEGSSKVILDDKHLLDTLNKLKFKKNHVQVKKKAENLVQEREAEEVVGKKMIILPSSKSSIYQYTASLPNQGFGLAIVQVPGMDLNLTATPDSYVDLLSIFDSLRPFQQLLLKCCSVIGNKFTRAMLDALLHCSDTEYMSHAIKQLFDNNILYCTEEKIRSSQSDKRCSCQHPQNTLLGFTLPSYSYCLNLGFRHPQFRDILYNLIPPNLKRIFHARAVEFLGPLSRRCSLCEKQMMGRNDSLGLTSKSDPNIVNTEFIHSESRKDGISLAMPKLLRLLAAPMVDLQECTCATQEYLILKQLIAHSVSAEQYLNAAQYNNHYARVCIAMENYDEARKTIQSITTQVKENVVPLTSAEKTVAHAELQLLLGELEFSTGNLDNALRFLLSVLRIVTHFCHLGRVHMPFFKYFLTHIRRRRESKLASRALVFITKILMIKKDFKEAQVVCSMCVKMLQRLDDKVQLSEVYANMVDIELSLQGNLLELNLEDQLASLALNLFPVRSVKNAATLGRLIHAIYLIRAMGAGDIVTGKELLSAMLQLSQHLWLGRRRDLMTLELIHLLTLQGNIEEAVAILLRLRDGSNIHHFWFHILCLEFLRFTGFCIEPPEKSVKIIKDRLQQANPLSPAHRRATISLLLWMLHTDPQPIWELQPPAISASNPTDIRCVADCVMRAEEMLALTVQACIIPVGVSWGSNLNRELRSLEAHLRIVSQRFRVMLPMYLHHRAYIALRLERNMPYAQQLLIEALNIAQQQGNELMINRILMTRESWRQVRHRSIPVAQTTTAREWTEFRRSNWANTMLKLP